MIISLKYNWSFNILRPFLEYGILKYMEMYFFSIKSTGVHFSVGCIEKF